MDLLSFGYEAEGRRFIIILPGWAVPAGLRDTHISTACTYQKKVILYQAWDKWIATITFQLKHCELYHKPHMLTLNYTTELKHWGCWSHWKRNHKPGTSELSSFTQTISLKTQKAESFHAGLQPEYSSARWPRSIPSCKGCWLAQSVYQWFGIWSISGLLCTWVDAGRNGQGRKHRPEGN